MTRLILFLVEPLAAQRAVSYNEKPMSIEEIEQAITQLPPTDLAKLAAWFEEFQTERMNASYLAAVEESLAEEWDSEEDHQAYDDL